MKSIDSQIARMEELWPGLEVVTRTDRGCVWQGHLSPHERVYQVQVLYAVPYAGQVIRPSRHQPQVTILSPELDRKDGQLPHVWWPTDGDPPFLCLFDPDAGEWSPDDFVAETTVPWALRWLVFYEGWLATGQWFGGGRDHPEDESKAPEAAPAKVKASAADPVIAKVVAEFRERLAKPKSQ